VALAEVANPRSLGDALQCCVMVKLLQKFLHEAELTFFCPDLKSGFFVFKDINLNAHLLDLGPVGVHNVLAYTLVHQSFLNKSTLKREKKSHSQSSNAGHVTIPGIPAVRLRYLRFSPNRGGGAVDAAANF